MLTMINDILRNLVGPRATRPYPVQKRAPFPRTRGHLVVEIEKCILCSACALRCPANAIVVSKDEGTLVLDPYRCIVCGECVAVCPSECLSMSPDHRVPA
ncbi:MAG: 4Fe-4S binding protein [Thermodesulfobacteriota bacterium]